MNSNLIASVILLVNSLAGMAMTVLIMFTPPNQEQLEVLRLFYGLVASGVSIGGGALCTDYARKKKIDEPPTPDPSNRQ